MAFNPFPPPDTSLPYRLEQAMIHGDRLPPIISLSGQQVRLPSLYMMGEPNNNDVALPQYRVPVPVPDSTQHPQTDPAQYMPMSRAPSPETDTSHTSRSSAGSRRLTARRDSHQMTQSDSRASSRRARARRIVFQARADDKSLRARSDRSALAESTQDIQDTLIAAYDGYQAIKQQSCSNGRSSGLIESKEGVLQLTSLILQDLLSRAAIEAKLGGPDAERTFRAQLDGYYHEAHKVVNNTQFPSLGEAGILGSDFEERCRGHGDLKRVGCAVHPTSRSSGGEVEWFDCRIGRRCSAWNAYVEREVRQRRTTQDRWH